MADYGGAHQPGQGQPGHSHPATQHLPQQPPPPQQTPPHPTVEDSNCTATEAGEMVPANQTEEERYRCPTGTSGSPSAEAPRCAATTSGTVPALTVTTLTCPQGSSGNPTTASPICATAGQTMQVPAEATTTYECGFDTQRDDLVDPPECVLFVGEVQDVPAIEQITYSCPTGFRANGQDPSSCDKVATPDCAAPTRAYGRFVCYAKVAPVVIEFNGNCPDGLERHPTLPEDSTDRWCLPYDFPCPMRFTYTPVDHVCLRPQSKPASAISGYVCPASVDAPDATVVLDRCQFSGRREVRELAEGTATYRCPDGSRGNGQTPDAICTNDQDGFVQALASTSYRCPMAQ